LREYDDDAMYEAEQEASAEAHYEQVGKEWARDHAEELAKEFFEDNYEDAVNQFTSERLQSYYLEQPELAVPALNALRYAQSLMPSFHQAALIFAVTATELTVKKRSVETDNFGLGPHRRPRLLHSRLDYKTLRHGSVSKPADTNLGSIRRV
jgi:hypothetical protein